MFLALMLRLQELQGLADIATANDEDDSKILKDMEKARDDFYRNFPNEYGFRFEDFEETLNLSYDYTP